MVSYEQSSGLNADHQTILAISLAMERVEKRHPNDFRENAKWKKMYALREKCSLELAKKQLEYHKDRYKRTKDIFSQRKVEQYQNYIDKYENKGEKNGDSSVLR